MFRCKKCATIIPEYEIYTNFYYCHMCKETMPTRAKPCKAALHMQAERLSGLESEMTMRQSEPSDERDGVIQK